VRQRLRTPRPNCTLSNAFDPLAGYTTHWNLGFWFLREAAEGRTYGGRVLEISGETSVRPYLLRPHTRFVEARYPAVDVMALDRAFPAASFDTVIAESVLEHVANPMLAVLHMRRVLRPGGHMLLMMPSTYVRALRAATACCAPSSPHTSVPHLSRARHALSGSPTTLDHLTFGASRLTLSRCSRHPSAV
jgi:SAM-dependent methyltransferase